MADFALTSTAFDYGETIPPLYTCDGENMIPPLTIANVPAGTEALALIVEDPDVPREVLESRVFDHWILFNIPPEEKEITADHIPGVPGLNTRGENGYTGPCPPPEYEPKEHRYFFTLYALTTTLPLPVGAKKQEVLEAMDGNVIGQTELLGRYQREEDR